MTRGSFSTTICHNGGGGFRQREQGYHISSVGRRYEDSLFSYVRTDGHHLCPDNNSVCGITLYVLRPDRGENLNINEKLKLLKKYKLAIH